MRTQDHPPQDPIEKLAWYLDSAFRVPGTRWRVGWDGIIGLVPGAGEILMLLAQSGIVLWAVSRHDLPPVLAARMLINVAIDAGIGSIPFIGDLFDFVFKANTRNVELIRDFRLRAGSGAPVSTARHYGFIFVVFLVLVGIIAAVVGLTVWILQWLYGILMPAWETGTLPVLS